MASRSLNRVILVGNLTRDPELKYTPSGTAVATFGVATNRSWTTSDGQQKEETQYHRIVAWQKLAELCGKILTKGKKVYLEGRLTYRTYTTKDGQQRSVAEIVLDDFIVFNNGKRQIENSSDQNNKESKNNEEKKEESLIEENSEENNSLPEAPIEEAETEQSQTQNEEVVNPEDIPF